MTRLTLLIALLVLAILLLAAPAIAGKAGAPQGITGARRTGSEEVC